MLIIRLGPPPKKEAFGVHNFKNSVKGFETSVLVTSRGIGVFVDIKVFSASGVDAWI